MQTVSTYQSCPVSTTRVLPYITKCEKTLTTSIHTSTHRQLVVQSVSDHGLGPSMRDNESHCFLHARLHRQTSERYSENAQSLRIWILIRRLCAYGSVGSIARFAIVANLAIAGCMPSGTDRQIPAGYHAGLFCANTIQHAASYVAIRASHAKKTWDL
jgi:hypothetical protein